MHDDIIIIVGGYHVLLPLHYGQKCTIDLSQYLQGLCIHLILDVCEESQT